MGAPPNFRGPRSFNLNDVVHARIVKTGQKLGSHVGPFVDSQGQSLSKNLLRSDRHFAILGGTAGRSQGFPSSIVKTLALRSKSTRNVSKKPDCPSSPMPCASSPSVKPASVEKVSVTPGDIGIWTSTSA